MSIRISVYSLVLISLCISLQSCKEDSSVMSHSDIDLSIQRLDQIVFDESETKIVESYPAFSEIYFSNIINSEAPLSQQDPQSLNAFRSDEFISELKASTDSLYIDLAEVKQELAAGLNLFQQATGEDQLPELYTFIGGLTYQCFLFDDQGKEGLAIGLDMFLGNAFPYERLSKRNPAFSSYLSRSFNRDHLVKKAMETLVEDRMGRAPGNRMLDQMIHNGKKAYILEQVLPFVSDTIIMEYSQQQLEWCEQNQQAIWSYLLRENLFYETDFKKISKLINPSPSSPGMPSEAPGRTANFIGWKIVKEFMRRNPEVTLNELIVWSDYQSLLDKSKFKPS